VLFCSCDKQYELEAQDQLPQQQQRRSSPSSSGGGSISAAGETPHARFADSSSSSSNVLHSAVLSGLEPVLVQLLKVAGVSVNARDAAGQTPLHLAATAAAAAAATAVGGSSSSSGAVPGRCSSCGGSNALCIMRWLLAAGARVDATAADGATPLHAAAAAGGAAAVALLLATPGAAAATAAVSKLTESGATPLHLAAMHGHADVTTALLDACGPLPRSGGGGRAAAAAATVAAAAANAANPQQQQQQSPLASLGRWVLTEAVNGAGQTPLHVAAGCNQVCLCVVVPLVVAGGMPRALPATSLPHDATAQVAAIRALAAGGADVDVWGGPEGTPLHTAAAGARAAEGVVCLKEHP
jgi:hypothetical protein